MFSSRPKETRQRHVACVTQFSRFGVRRFQFNFGSSYLIVALFYGGVVMHRVTVICGRVVLCYVLVVIIFYLRIIFSNGAIVSSILVSFGMIRFVVMGGLIVTVVAIVVGAIIVVNTITAVIIGVTIIVFDVVAIIVISVTITVMVVFRRIRRINVVCIFVGFVVVIVVIVYIIAATNIIGIDSAVITILFFACMSKVDDIVAV